MRNIFFPQDLRARFILWACIVATFSTAGSMYFSEYDGYIPCHLCWWQRIAIFPLTAIFAYAYYKRDYQVYLVALPFLFLGTAVSIYHNIIYYRANFFQVGSYTAPCLVNGPSCTERYIEFFHFISIPALALLALLLMNLFMVLLWKNRKN